MKKYIRLLPIGVPLLFLLFTALYLMDTRKYLTNKLTMLFVWPVVSLIVLFSVIAIVQELRKNIGYAELPASEIEKNKEHTTTIRGKNFPTSILLLISSILYIVLMNAVGFVIATIIFPVAWMYLTGIRNLKTLVIVPLLLTAAIYLGLKKLLLVPLPEGFLGIVGLL